MSPMNRRDYPADWPLISERIRERAGHKCEWCGVPNHKLILRGKDARYVWYDSAQDCHFTPDGRPIRMDELPDDFIESKYIRVVLTVAHLNHDPADCRSENLVALCQRCHLRYAAKHHAETRRRKKIERLGQLSLF